ncbi:helix-turn-helix domain-containing protein [Micromonospora sp. DR5-3]|uniref:PucR family transcriptional regulator n=1 Tax=unclassified Micromonospora TaxID=2617518 RepID=UPI0011D4BFFC|nr:MULTISPECIES: PucR family transcriptional regulator [unclassified Micromonospora]MCW3818127.1 helix-turn-helix domain-containing protein [Micromonospora sp. DR5-3]TYC21782.1 PucR family transcriptional regulator [Micromonospora sp. MP36]
MITVAGTVDAVGAALLKIVVPAGEAEVRDVTLAELDEAPTGQSGDLVLGAGVVTPDQARAVIERCAAAAAAGLVLKPPLAAHPDVTTYAAEREVTLVELQSHGSWAQLVWLLRGVIDRAAAPGSPETGETGVYDELFALADAAAAIVDAPVTIEDAQYRVIAYSSRQDRTDPARVSTIVGRRVPGDVIAHFRTRGVFRKLATGSQLIFVPQGPDGTLPRLVIPIRAGGELLGSIWAVVEGPLPDERLRDLQGAASALALHLLRLRVQADVARRVSADRLRAALRAPARTGPEELGLPKGPWRVVALGAHGGTGEMVHNLALWESISRRHGWRQPLLADVGDVLFAVVVDQGETPGSWRWLDRLIRDIAAHDPGLRAASGGVASDLSDLPRSRAEAAEVLALHGSARRRGSVLRFEDVWAEVVVHRVVSTVPEGDLLIGGPLPDLVAHDRKHGTDYVATLAAWLEQQGDPRKAARQLHVHPNTLRHRLRRLAEVVHLDLESPRTRLALQIQLAALRPGP